MKRTRFYIILPVILGMLYGCGAKHEKVMVEPTPPVQQQSVKIKVVDVSNNTGEIFDVDVIGMLWNSLDESLKKRGLLWVGEQSSSPPLTLDAHIVKYQKGNLFMRPVLPMWGKTALAVRCDLKDGDRVVTTVESKHVISLGSGAFTVGAWKKVFSEVSEDLVQELARKM